MTAANPTVQALVDRFERENNELISIVEKLSDAQCRTRSTSEGWPLLVLAHHVAVDHAIIAEIARSIAAGQTRAPITFAMLDQMNAKHAEEHADCTKTETIDLLRRNGRLAETIIGALSDNLLDRTAIVFAGAPPMSAKQLIETILIDHIVEHRASMLRTEVGLR